MATNDVINFLFFVLSVAYVMGIGALLHHSFEQESVRTYSVYSRGMNNKEIAILAIKCILTVSFVYACFFASYLMFDFIKGLIHAS